MPVHPCARNGTKSLLSVCLVVVLSFALCGPAHGSVSDEIMECLLKAEERYGVPSWLLWSVAKVESGFNPRAFNTNTNGTHDIGLMQINSGWLPTLRRHGIGVSDLWDVCTNIMVGAWVMAQNIQKMGWNWDAIGAYNARSKERRIKYAWKIYRAIGRAYGHSPGEGGARR